jgi:hypothetical protein
VWYTNAGDLLSINLKYRWSQQSRSNQTDLEPVDTIEARLRVSKTTRESESARALRVLVTKPSAIHRHGRRTNKPKVLRKPMAMAMSAIESKGVTTTVTK